MSFSDGFRGKRDDQDEGQAPAMIECEEALRRVQEFLDGELEELSLREVEAHYDVCRRCYPHLRFEQAFREAVRRPGASQTPPPALRDRPTEMLAGARQEG